MGADAVEGVILNVLGLPDVNAEAVAVKSMPHDAHIQHNEDTGGIVPCAPEAVISSLRAQAAAQTAVPRRLCPQA